MANVKPVPVEKLRNEYAKESWLWDADNKSQSAVLSKNRKAAYFHTDPVIESTGTAGVRGSRGFTHGEHYWEIVFVEPPCGTSVMVGVGTERTLLHTEDYDCIDLLGRDEHSWGLSYKGTTWHKSQATSFCEPFYNQSTVIGLHLNMYRGTLTFYKDGGQCLGQAFHDPRLSSERLFPVISSTAPCSELEVGLTTCRYWSLQEKCCHVVTSNMSNKDDISRLPLPTPIQSRLVGLM